MKRKIRPIFLGAAMGVSMHLLTIKKQKGARRRRSHIPYGPYEAVWKRMLDIVFSGLSLIVLSPVLAVIGLQIRIKLGKPVIFTQERTGQIDPVNGREKIFRLYKFRTMTDARDIYGNLLSDEQRMTEFGKWLRSTSLDELPELFNILKGDMSIVGPRPLLEAYLPYYTAEERKRHAVRPGLTGNAQVNGRSFISWEDIFSYDVSYVNNITLRRDIEIILKTMSKVAHRENIADVSEAKLDADGKYHFKINGRDQILHQRLDVERKAYEKRDRKQFLAETRRGKLDKKRI